MLAVRRRIGSAKTCWECTGRSSQTWLIALLAN